MKTFNDSAPSTGLKLLLVDDVPQGTIARKSVLKGLGYEVESAECPFEALKLAGSQRFDLIVTDYVMPGMDGIELIRQIREAQPGVKFVLLSGRAQTMGITEQSSGADAVIAKSGTELNELTRTIKKLLTRKPARKPVGSAKKPPAFMVKSS